MKDFTEVDVHDPIPFKNIREHTCNSYTLAFTPYITSPNVLETSLNFNNKIPNVLTIFIISSY